MFVKFSCLIVVIINLNSKQTVSKVSLKYLIKKKLIFFLQNTNILLIFAHLSQIQIELSFEKILLNEFLQF